MHLSLRQSNFYHVDNKSSCIGHFKSGQQIRKKNIKRIFYVLLFTDFQDAQGEPKSFIPFFLTRFFLLYKKFLF